MMYLAELAAGVAKDLIYAAAALAASPLSLLRLPRDVFAACVGLRDGGRPWHSLHLANAVSFAAVIGVAFGVYLHAVQMREIAAISAPGRCPATAAASADADDGVDEVVVDLEYDR